MKKIVRLTESDLTIIVKKVIKEQRGDIPKDVKLAHDKYLMSPTIEDYIFEDSWHDVQSMYDNKDFNDTEELIEVLAHGFTFMAGTMYAYGENPDIEEYEVYEIEEDMSDQLLQYYDNEQIVRKVLENINHPKKEEVFAFIDKVKGITKDSTKLAKRRRGIKLSGNELYQHIKDTYVDQIEDEANIDDFVDEFDYYDNIIGWAVEKYIEAEEPEREDDWGYRDELADNLKDYWMPI